MRYDGLLALTLASSLGLGCVVLPPAPPDEGLKRVALDQAWRMDERRAFYHQSQGSVILPYEWFVALEQPEIKFVGSVGLFRDPGYLGRFGFLPDVTQGADAGSSLRPVQCEPKTGPTVASSDPAFSCGLPVGLSRARVTMVTEPEVGEQADVVGFTCAGCHTGEIHHRGTAIRIEGASNIVDVTQFQSALGASLALTQRFPFRFTRFANRVLKARGIERRRPTMPSSATSCGRPSTRTWRRTRASSSRPFARACTPAIPGDSAAPMPWRGLATWCSAPSCDATTTLPSPAPR